MKATLTASFEGTDWHHALYGLLRSYCFIPHSATGIAQSKLLFQRRLQMKIPQIASKVNTNVIDSLVRKNDIGIQTNEYVDNKKHAQCRTFHVDDCVVYSMTR